MGSFGSAAAWLLDRRSVGVFDGAETGGDAGFAGGDGLAVSAAVGALGQAATGAFDLADVGFAFVGMGGDGEEGDVGGGGVQDQTDGLGVGVAAGQGQDPGAVDVGPGLFGVDVALPDPVVEVDEFDVGSVDLVADGGEVVADGAEFGAAVVGVFQEPGGLRLVGVAAGAGVLAQFGPEERVDRPGVDEVDQAVGEVAVSGAGRPARWPAAGR